MIENLVLAGSLCSRRLIIQSAVIGLACLAVDLVQIPLVLCAAVTR